MSDELDLSQGPIARRAHRKSKTGCRACKKRKVKCDERRPVCHNCQQHFIGVERCEYGPALANTSRPREPLYPKRKSPQVNTSSRRNGGRKSNSVMAIQPKEEKQENTPTTLTTLPACFGCVGLDPFQTFPATKVAGVDSLLTHYLTVFVSESFPFFTQDALLNLWWPSIGSDELLFHTTLLLSSLDLEKRNHRKQGDNRWRLAMRECIRLLRERIDEQTRTQDISDETIVSVAYLAAVEHERGDFKSLQLHAEGLQRMIQLRGGLDAIKSTHLVAANIISWILMVVLVEAKPPELACLEYNDSADVSPSQQDDSYGSPPWLQSYLPETFTIEDLEAAGIHYPATSLLIEVRHLTTRFTRASDPSPADEWISVFNNLCSLVQNLLRLCNSSNSSPEFPFQPVLNDTSQSACLAAALHILSPLCGMHPDPTLLVNCLSSRLRSLLAALIPHLSPASPGRTTQEIFLWLLSIGAVSARSNAIEREWYLGYLVVLTGDLEITSWEGMKQTLAKMMWNDILCERGFGALWREVVGKRKELEW